MLTPPAVALTPVLDADGIMRLQRTVGFPGPPTPRIPGPTLLPTGLPAEQGLVWLFPRLLDHSLHPAHIRQHLLQSWNWAFGAAAHRAILTHCHPGADPVESITAVRDQLTRLLSIEPADKKVAQIAALLDQHVDVFGPSDDAQFQAWRWGRQAEYQLGHALGPDAWANSTSDLVRYGSRQDMDMLDTADLTSRVDTLLRVYVPARDEIVAIWHGHDTPEQTAVQNARRTRNAAIVNGARGAYEAVQNHRDRKASRRAANAVAMNEAALADYRRARASHLRGRRSLF